MDIYNVQTRRKDSIDDPVALQQAILNGTHAFSAGSQVIVKSPDGRMGKIPAEKAAEAVKAGFQIETNSQRAVREYVDENKGLRGAVKVGLGQFVDEALIGLPELVYNKTQDPLEVAKKEALKKEHDLANSIGGLSGFGASMFVGAPLWKAGSKAGEKVAAHLAEKIAVQAGAESTKGGFKKAASGVAGKIGGSVTEGAIVTAPTAITELALGDPEAAAETMLTGVGIGALFGAGAGLGKEFLGLGKKVSAETAKIIGEADLNAQTIARRAAKVVTGYDDEDILYYMKNADRVNQAPTMEALKDQIDSQVKKVRDEFTILDEARKNATLEYQLAKQNLKRDLQQVRAPQELADELVGALDNQKAVLGEMSDQAEKILEDSGAFLPKKKVLRMIDQIKKDVVPFQVGEKAKAAAAKLNTLRDDINKSFPGNIDSTELRSILRQVRDDIDYNQMAGEFNDRANRARKAFTNSVSEALKDQSPEYAELMAQMSVRAQNLEKMSKIFGSREQAANTLTGMLKPGKEVRNELLDEFSRLTDQDFTKRFQELVKAKDDLEQLNRGVDLGPKLLPNLFNREQELAVKTQRAKDLLDQFSRIGESNSQAAIKNMARKEPNIQIRRAFEKLEELTGTPILEQIKDRNILDAFSKQSTQGSRKVNAMSLLLGSLGAAAGFSVGGPLGLAAGAAAGATLDIYGNQILKSFIDRNPNVAGLLFVEKAMKKTADDIDKLPGIIERLTSQKGIKKSTIAIDALYRLTDSPKDKNVNEQISDITDKMNTWLTDSTMFENMIGRFTGPLSEGGAPKIAQGLTIGAQKALAYLQQAVPKPPAPSSPFAPKIAWNPSDFEINKFAQIAQVAENPMVVLEELEQGTLTDNHIDALKNMFPNVYMAIQNKIMQTAAENPKPLPYQARVNLSRLAGVPLDDTLTPENILKLQSKYMREQEDQDLNQNPEFSPKQDIKMATANLTTLQSAMMQ